MKKEDDKNGSEIRVEEGEGVSSSTNIEEKKEEPYKSKVYHQFVDFFSLPDFDKCQFLEMTYDTKTKKFNEEPTLKAFAKKFGVHTDTLRVWKKRDDFIAAVDLKRKEWGADKVPNVLAALYRRCIRYGMSYDIETYLAFYIGWDKKTAVEKSGTLFDLNDIRALIAPLPKAKQEEFYATITKIIAEAELSRGGSEVQGDQSHESGADKK